jgi:hypothetical protein
MKISNFWSEDTGSKRRPGNTSSYGSGNSYSNGPGSSYSSGPGGNNYGGGFNPFGSRDQQNAGRQNEYKKYTDYNSTKKSEEAKKEFEEFFKRASSQFGKGAAGFKGFDRFSKRFKDSFQEQNRANQGYKDPRQEFYKKYKEKGVPVT